MLELPSIAVLAKNRGGVAVFIALDVPRREEHGRGPTHPLVNEARQAVDVVEDASHPRPVWVLHGLEIRVAVPSEVVLTGDEAIRYAGCARVGLQDRELRHATRLVVRVQRAAAVGNVGPGLAASHCVVGEAHLTACPSSLEEDDTSDLALHRIEGACNALSAVLAGEDVSNDVVGRRFGVFESSVFVEFPARDAAGIVSREDVTRVTGEGDLDELSGEVIAVVGVLAVGIDFAGFEARRSKREGPGLIALVGDLRDIAGAVVLSFHGVSRGVGHLNQT